LKDVSPDGTKVLIYSTSNLYNKEAILYLVNLNSLDSPPIKLASALPNYYGKNSGAKWIDDSRIVYIGQGERGYGIYKINADGTNQIYIGEGYKPYEILAMDSTRIYWDTQVTTRLSSNSVNNKYYVWWSNLDGTGQGHLEYNGKQIYFGNVGGPNFAFSPDASKIAWNEMATPQYTPPYHNYLHIASISDINNPYTLEDAIGEPIIWQPDSSKILVFNQGSVIFGSKEISGEYYGVFEVPVNPELPVKNLSLATDKMIAMLKIPGGRRYATMVLYDISPDGRQILCKIYEIDAAGEFVGNLYFLNLETSALTEAKGFRSELDNIHWIP
jgi:hypothetical protein